jgi:hypothetical protein
MLSKVYYLFFGDFSRTEERIERALRSYELAERAAWSAVTAAMHKYKAAL